MTFAGTPRDHHVDEHAHESPKVMYVPLVILAVFAIVVGWPVFRFAEFAGASSAGGTAGDGRPAACMLPWLVHPSEHLTHISAVDPRRGHDLGDQLPRLWRAFCWPRSIYLWRLLNPDEMRQPVRVRLPAAVEQVVFRRVVSTPCSCGR